MNSCITEYYSTFGIISGLRIFKTQKQAAEYMQVANDHFARGVLFHKEDGAGRSLLPSDQ